jgi:hypothetical protein
MQTLPSIKGGGGEKQTGRSTYPTRLFCCFFFKRKKNLQSSRWLFYSSFWFVRSFVSSSQLLFFRTISKSKDKTQYTTQRGEDERDYIVDCVIIPRTCIDINVTRALERSACNCIWSILLFHHHQKMFWISFFWWSEHSFRHHMKQKTICCCCCFGCCNCGLIIELAGPNNI